MKFRATIVTAGKTATGIEAAKAAATRERRIAGAITMLLEGKR